MNNSMMKSIRKCKLGIGLLAFMVCVGFGIEAKAEVYGDFEYEVLEDNTVEITDYIGDSGIIVIPDTIDGKYVVSIADGALQPPWDGKPISSISVSSNNQYFSSQDGVLFNKDKTLLISCPETKKGTYTIPASVSEIGYTAFISCKKLTNIVIPDGVTHIGAGAFECCYGLTQIYLPDSVQIIECNAFYGSGLTSIEIPPQVTYIDGQVFKSCDELQKVTLPEGVKAISYSAFEDCYSLKQIKLPETLTRIGDNAFAGCDELQSVIMSDNVTELGDLCFSCCGNLSKIKMSKNITKIGSLAFLGCTSLKRLTIPVGVNSLQEDFTWDIILVVEKGSYGETYAKAKGIDYEYADGTKPAVRVGDKIKVSGAVYKITNKKKKTVTYVKPTQKKSKVTIPATVKIYGQKYKVTTVGANAFKNNKKLNSVVIGKNVVTIEKNAFCNCKSLKKITIKSNVLKKVGKNAFKNISKRPTLIVPKSKAKKYIRLLKKTGMSQ